MEVGWLQTTFLIIITVISNSTFLDNIYNDNDGLGASSVHIYSGTGTHNNITIINSIFANNNVVGEIGGGLHVFCSRSTYNNIAVIDSTFTNNTVNGSGGGLYLDFFPVTHNNVSIVNSTFTNSIGSDGGGLVIFSIGTINNIAISDSIFSYNVYVRGGGAYIDLLDNVFSNIKIVNSRFTYNNVTNEGGGLYIRAEAFVYNNISITSTVASNNTIGSRGGGVLLVLSREYDVFNASNVANITNSIFTYNYINSVHAGGGVFINFIEALYYAVNITNCIFSENAYTGMRVYGSYKQLTIADSTFSNNNVNGGGLCIFTITITHDIIVNSTFTSNSGYGLKLIGARTVVLLSQVTISNNMGSGVETGGQCTVIFTKGDSIIANNTSSYGGGIYLDDNSALTTNNDGHITFVNNTAKIYGGAIYSPHDDKTNFNSLLYVSINDKCTIYDLSATFINNSAMRAGDILYGGTFLYLVSIVKVRSK